MASGENAADVAARSRTRDAALADRGGAREQPGARGAARARIPAGRVGGIPAQLAAPLRRDTPRPPGAGAPDRALGDPRRGRLARRVPSRTRPARVGAVAGGWPVVVGVGVADARLAPG